MRRKNATNDNFNINHRLFCCKEGGCFAAMKYLKPIRGILLKKQTFNQYYKEEEKEKKNQLTDYKQNIHLHHYFLRI